MSVVVRLPSWVALSPASWVVDSAPTWVAVRADRFAAESAPIWVEVRAPIWVASNWPSVVVVRLATWVVDSANDAAVPVSVFDGDGSGTLVDSLVIDQTTMRIAATLDGHSWQSIGVVAPSSGTLTVQYNVTAAGGRVVADAVKLIEAVPATYQTYDGLGRLIRETDALGHTTEYGYDVLGRRTSETDANGDTTFFGYDLQGRMTRLEDPLGNVTTFVYNDRGQLLQERVTLDGATYTRSNTYDVLGNLVRSVDRQGRVKVYEYDELFRLRREYWYDELGVLQNTITTTYDVLNRVAAVADDFSSYAYGYDALDRVVTETVANPGVPPVTLTTTYDRLDGLRSSFAATIDGVADFQTTYAYDAMLRMTDVTQTGQGGNAVADKHVHFDYDDNGQFDSITRYASVGTSNVVATTDYQYDSSNRLTALTHAQGATTLAAYTWTFDAANRLVQQTSPDGTVDYSYDSRGQLTGADYDYQDDESYVYDENGNRITATNESTGTDTYATGDHNRLAFDGTYTYRYDSEGNRTARFIDGDSNGAPSAGDTEVTEYAWDIAHRLTRIVDRDVADGPATSAVDYLYDLYGRRIGKQLDNDGDGNVDYSESYVYDATDVVLDFVDSDGDGSLSPELAKRYLWGAAVDQLLAQEDVLWGTGAPEDVAWPLADHLGTTRDVIDSTGAVLTHFQVDAFGSILAGDVAVIRYIYTCQEYDPESGLYFYDARYYDSVVAKFISDDPIGIQAQDANFSRYVANNPISSIDPSGLDETVFAAEGRVAHEAIKEWFVERFGVGKAKFEQSMPRDFPVAGEVRGRVDVIRGKTITEVGPASLPGVAAKNRQVTSLTSKMRKNVILYRQTGRIPQAGDTVRFVQISDSDLKKLVKEVKRSDLPPDEIWRRVRELGDEQTIEVSKKAAKAAGKKYLRNRLITFTTKKAVRTAAEAAKVARKGATDVPVLGALVTTAFTAYDFATSPYPPDTDVVFHPRVDYTIEEFLNSIAVLPLFPMSAEEFIEIQQKAAFEAAWQSKLPAPGAGEEESTGTVIIVP